MDVNEEEMLISLRSMRNSDYDPHENSLLENGHSVARHVVSHHHHRHQQQLLPSNGMIKASSNNSLQWLDLKVFYVRLNNKSVIIDDCGSTPEFLTLNHVPLSRDTLLEVNCVRTSMCSDGESTLLKRDRLNKKSEEVTFVSTDCVRMTGSVKFEVLHRDGVLLSGTLESCLCNQGTRWSMSCESDMLSATGTFLKGNDNQCQSPVIEVYVAGSFSGSPVVLTKTLQLVSYKKKQTRKGMLECIPEYEATRSRKDELSTLSIPSGGYSDYKEKEGHLSPYFDMEYLEGEDGELSWFNAGVRLGVGIGLSISLGVGIGVGLLVRTYQGTTGNFRRRLL